MSLDVTLKFFVYDIDNYEKKASLIHYPIPEGANIDKERRRTNKIRLNINQMSYQDIENGYITVHMLFTSRLDSGFKAEKETWLHIDVVFNRDEARKIYHKI